jgi:hypothetical protein
MESPWWAACIQVGVVETGILHCCQFKSLSLKANSNNDLPAILGS